MSRWKKGHWLADEDPDNWEEYFRKLPKTCLVEVRHISPHREARGVVVKQPVKSQKKEVDPEWTGVLFLHNEDAYNLKEFREILRGLIASGRKFTRIGAN